MREMPPSVRLIDSSRHFQRQDLDESRKCAQYGAAGWLGPWGAGLGLGIAQGPGNAAGFDALTALTKFDRGPGKTVTRFDEHLTRVDET